MAHPSESLERDDRHYMRRALLLARRGVSTVPPNPPVGAVVVQNGAIAGTGYHRHAGGPHAEVLALDQAGDAARGATLYVTLEPCNHFGLTPPCADRVLERGVKRVVAAIRDPNPLVRGGGLERLRDAGVEVSAGCLADETRDLLAPWISHVEGRGRTLLYAVGSLDGYRCDHARSVRSGAAPAVARLLRLAGAYEGAAVVAAPEIAVETGPRLPRWLGTEPPTLGERELLESLHRSGSLHATLAAAGRHSLLAPLESDAGRYALSSGADVNVLLIHLPLILGAGTALGESLGGEQPRLQSLRLSRVGRQGDVAWSLYRTD